MRCKQNNLADSERNWAKGMLNAESVYATPVQGHGDLSDLLVQSVASMSSGRGLEMLTHTKSAYSGAIPQISEEHPLTRRSVCAIVDVA